MIKCISKIKTKKLNKQQPPADQVGKGEFHP